jgi:hypothetical protein
MSINIADHPQWAQLNHIIADQWPKSDTIVAISEVKRMARSFGVHQFVNLRTWLSGFAGGNTCTAKDAGHAIRYAWAKKRALEYFVNSRLDQDREEKIALLIQKAATISEVSLQRIYFDARALMWADFDSSKGVFTHAIDCPWAGAKPLQPFTTVTLEHAAINQALERIKNRQERDAKAFDPMAA